MQSTPRLRLLVPCTHPQPLPSSAVLLYPVQEYEGLPSFIRGQLCLDQVNGTLALVHSMVAERAAGGGMAGGWSCGGNNPRGGWPAGIFRVVLAVGVSTLPAISAGSAVLQQIVWCRTPVTVFVVCLLGAGFTLEDLDGLGMGPKAKVGQAVAGGWGCLLRQAALPAAAWVAQGRTAGTPKQLMMPAWGLHRATFQGLAQHQLDAAAHPA